MTAGLGLLRLPPAVFWAMTPRELAAALRALSPAGLSALPLGRTELVDLMGRFPDL
jgi:uncharacterized phage protein (TIGR02216 family)